MRSLDTRSPSEWDYIIVGAGSAGCALAHQLACRQPSASILLVEAGPSDRTPFIHFQAGAFRAIAKHDWGYRAEPDPTRKGLAERWIRGKVLGGTSSINSTIYVRGAHSDFDRWASGDAGPMRGWSSAEVMPLFRELEASDQPSPLRGRTGPLHVRSMKQPHAITDAFIRSTVAAGYPFNPDYNAEAQEGVGHAQLTLRHGWRWTAADAFLKPLLRGGRIALRVETFVEKIEIHKGRAVAVCLAQRGAKYRERARHVILCAGVINSPKLLMLSGIGDAHELRRHQIQLAIDLPSVGRNLRDHPLVVMAFRSRVETYNLSGGMLQKAKFLAQFLRAGEGPLANIFESLAFLRSTPAEPHPDIQLHFTPVAWWFTPDSKLVLPRFPAVSVFINKSHAASSGRVRLASSNPHDAPRIECRLFEKEADLETLARGVLVVRRIMRTEPIASMIDGEFRPGTGVETFDALKEHLRESATIANHGVGTCRMGVDSQSVVGPDLRVQGTENLWVADASIMPEHISGNPSAACMMIGMKLGREIAAGAGAAIAVDTPTRRTASNPVPAQENPRRPAAKSRSSR